MKTKTINQIEEMKKQTIGVEIEFVGITRAKAAEKVAEYFGTTATYEGGGYHKYQIRDQKGRAWHIVYDSSLRAYNDSEKCELVTPILKYEDIETLQEVVRVLRRAGAISNASKRCGVHIHIGADGHTATTLRHLTNIMASHETLLKGAINIGRERMDYCKVTNQRFLNEVNKKKPQTMEQLKRVWYNDSQSYHGHYNQTRYHMLNLHALEKGTIEFRLFNFEEPDGEKKNGLHAGLLKSWIQLCLAMSQQAKTMKSSSPKEPQMENQKFAMRTWCTRLHMIGPEFATARKLLMKNLTGDSAWRYGRPAA